MINTETLFILGAGASKPYGYPTAVELRKDIINNFKKLFFDYKLLKEYPGSTDDYSFTIDQFLNSFEKSSTHSIDLFLSLHNEFANIGKISILVSLIKSENESCFRENCVDDKNDIYTFIFRKLTHTLTTKDDYSKFSNNKINFITYNYDRSFEYYLNDTLKHYFSIEMNKKLFHFIIFHVFGKIALLPWEGGYYGYKKIPKNEQILQDLITQIETPYTNATPVKCRINKDLLDKAKKIFFLGFGYAEENMKILDIPNSLKADQMIYGTAMGKSIKEISDIRNAFGEIFKDNENLKIEDCTCLDLLKNYL